MQRTNTMAIVSLVAAIASWLGFYGIGSLVAIICGHMARKQIRMSGEGGDGLALIGLVVGYINLVSTVLGVLIFIVFFGGMVCVGAAANM